MGPVFRMFIVKSSWIISTHQFGKMEMLLSFIDAITVGPVNVNR